MHGPERPVDETVTILLQVQLSHRPGGLVPCENFTSPRFSSTGKSGLRAVMLSPRLLAGRGLGMAAISFGLFLTAGPRARSLRPGTLAALHG